MRSVEEFCLGHNKRLIENIGSLAVLQGANYILPLITLPYLVRVLGPEKFGLIVFAQAFIQYFVVLTDYGFNLSATRQIAICRDNSDEVSRIFSSVMVIKFGLIVLSFLLMSAIVRAVPRFHADRHLYFICFLMVVGNTLFPTWLFQGMEKMKYITILNISAKSAAVVAIFLFVHKPSDYLVAAGIQSGGFVLAGFLGLVFLQNIVRIRYAFPSWSSITMAATEGWHIFVSTAAISLYTNSNAFILGLVTNNVTVGYFCAADKISRAAQSLLSPVHQAIYPHISALSARSREMALGFTRRALGKIALFGLLISIPLFIFARPLVMLAFGSDYAASVTVLRWMAFLPFVTGVTNVFGMQVMLPFGMSRFVSKIAVCGGLADLAYIVPLVNAFHATGAAMSLFITEVLVLLMCVYTMEKQGFRLLGIRGTVA